MPDSFSSSVAVRSTMLWPRNGHRVGETARSHGGNMLVPGVGSLMKTAFKGEFLQALMAAR